MKRTTPGQEDDYPLASRRPDLLKTISGKNFLDITLEGVADGKIGAQDIRIRAETLELQARIAEAHGRPHLALNLRRAAELTAVSDEEILRMYNSLRPGRSSKEDLLRIADELEKKYHAKLNASLFREAAETYGQRNLLRGGEVNPS